jgi:hypothetical protein
MTDDDRPGDVPKYVPEDSSGDAAADAAAQGQPQEPTEPTEQAEPQRQRGSINYQDASTAPREPTLGEQRARRRAAQEEQQRRRDEQAEVERKAKKRKRILIGAGVTVGVVAVVAVIYAAATPDEVTAHCVGDDDITSSDVNVCDESYVTSHGGYHSGGIFFLPIGGGGGYRQYHYNYGGTVGSGGRVTGGSISAPSNATVKTSSGKTIQRGGFGVSSGSSGKSSGS